MASSYPGGVDVFTGHADGIGERIHASHVNALQDAVAAVETELGVNPSGAADTVAARLAAIDGGSGTLTFATVNATTVNTGTANATTAAAGTATADTLTVGAANAGTGAAATFTTAAVGTATVPTVAVKPYSAAKRALDVAVATDTASRLRVDMSAGSGSGTITFGDGTAADTNLYRGGADRLRTDDALEVDGTAFFVGSVQVNGAAEALGGGAGVVSVNNRVTAPTSNNASGGILYAEAGALTWRGSGGLVTVLGGATATNTQTDSYTLVLADAATTVEINKATAVTLTVPPNASVAFPVGTCIPVRQYGAGQVTVAAGAGVTIRSRGGALKLAGQYAEAVLTKRAAPDEWVLSGDITT